MRPQDNINEHQIEPTSEQRRVSAAQRWERAFDTPGSICHEERKVIEALEAQVAFERELNAILQGQVSDADDRIAGYDRAVVARNDELNAQSSEIASLRTRLKYAEKVVDAARGATVYYRTYFGGDVEAVTLASVAHRDLILALDALATEKESE